MSVYENISGILTWCLGMWSRQLSCYIAMSCKIKRTWGCFPSYVNLNTVEKFLLVGEPVCWERQTIPQNGHARNSHFLFDSFSNLYFPALWERAPCEAFRQWKQKKAWAQRENCRETIKSMKWEYRKLKIKRFAVLEQTGPAQKQKETV